MRSLVPHLLFLGTIAGCSEATAPSAHPGFKISPRSLELAEGRFGALTLLTNLPDYSLRGLTNWSYLGDQPSSDVGFSYGPSLPWPRDVFVHAWGATTGRIVVQHSSGLADTVPIRVHGVSVAAVNLEPVSVSITVGQSTDIYARVVDSVETELQRLITWTSSDSSVATIEYWPSSGFSSGLRRRRMA